MDVFDLFAKISLDTSEYEKGLDEASGKSSSFIDKLGNGIATAAAVGTAAVAATTAAVTAVGTSVINATGDIAEYGDNIDKMSQKMGISAEAYQEWDAIMQHSGTSIEALKPSIKTLASAAEKGSDAFEKLGISQEEVANLSQEDLFARVISGLQEMEEGTERTYITSQLLGRGATELGALLNTSAEDTEKMRQRVHELGGVMSNDAVKAAAAYQDSLQDMQTALAGLSRNILSDFLPSVTSVMDGITNIFAGDMDLGLEQISDGIDEFIENITTALPRMIEVGSSIIEALGTSIIDNLPSILDAAIQTMTMLFDGLINALPMVVDAAMQIILALALGLADALPTLIPTLVDTMLLIVNTLVDNIDLLADASIAIIMGLATGLIAAMPRLIIKVPVIVEKLVKAFVDNAPKLLNAAVTLILTLTNATLDNLPMLIDATVVIVTALTEAFIENAPMLLEAAIKIIAALTSGLAENGQKLFEMAPELIGKLVEGFVANYLKLVEMGNKLVGYVKDGISKKIEDARKWGKDLIDNFISGIKSKINAVGNAIKDVGEKIKGLIGFSEPEDPASPLHNFHTYAPDMMKLFAQGIEDNTNLLTDQISKSFDFGGLIGGLNAETSMLMAATNARPSLTTGTAAGSAKATENRFYLDGREIARAILPYLEEERQRLGTSLTKGALT